MKARYLLMSLLIAGIGYVTTAQETQSDNAREAQIKAEEQRMRDEMIKRDPRMKKFFELQEQYGDDREGFHRAYAQYQKELREESVKEKLDEYLANTRPDTLVEIDLNDARLDKLPDFVLEASQLKTLRINNNDFRKLPGKLKRLENLTKIQWEDNVFAGKPKLGKLPYLKELIMGKNGLVKAPKTRKLPALEMLDLSDNELTKIPVKAVRKNAKLDRLTLTGNPIEVGPGKYDQLVYLKSLKLNKCGLTTIHPDLYAIPNLLELQLQENQLTGLPEGISRMDSLSKLSLYKNQLETLPTDLFEIPKLEVVDLYYNQLDVIPGNISKAQNLDILYLSHNKIYDVPESLGKLTNLKELYLHHNRISALPSTITNLKKLRVLRINDNLFSSFPAEVLELDMLENLDLDNNVFETVPVGISQLQNLQLFTFLNNPVDFDAPENKGLAQAIYALVQGGTMCKPHVYAENVE